ncbi:MAG TPA: HAMP domain-containing sensor histidine kinase [Flavihumibacter sp.]|nr:HAMP domain-containing histidine kinase [Bacteroidota bacterium]HPZ89325.1 HAMP domain-containing sensor histidine kinase [Flavihumibacter sp.]HQD09579.1 HAMP domain-containing sensor histidine kinase [Flavihumibacter sp.]
MSNIYRTLSANRLLAKNYTFKFLFVAFIGIHLPLLGLIALVSFVPHHLNPMSVFLTALVLTLLATIATLWILKGLLSPIIRANAALVNYRFNREVSALPMHFTDEAGQLMRDVQLTITELNDLLDEKQILSEFIAHDLKMPIVNIRLMIGALPAALQSPERVEEIIENINLSLIEQESLLQQVAELIKQHDSIAISMKREPSSLNECIRHAIRNQQPTAQYKQISIEFNPADDYTLPLATEIFQQAIKNILNNSIKFSHPGSTIRIQTSKSTNTVCIQFNDDGIGFTAEQGETLFERLKKGQKGTAGEESTGLGLYLTRKILEGHNAVIRGGSDGPNKGAWFRICLFLD